MATIYSDDFMNLVMSDETSTLSLVWKPATEKLTDEGFKLALAMFAAEAIAHRARNVIVNVHAFKRSHPSDEVEAWRQNAIIPLYNRSSITRFAYVVPAGAPLKPVSPADGHYRFDTGFHHTDADALAWFAGR